MFMLLIVGVLLGGTLILLTAGLGEGLAFLFVIVGLLGTLVPSIAVQVRRLHDQDKSGWFALFNLLPYAGGIVMLIFMLIEGTHGDNRYGPDPVDRS